MGNNRITTTERSGLSVSQVGGNDIYKMLPQVRSIVERGNLGEDYLTLFAEPVDGGRTIDWYADEEGDVARVTELPKEEQVLLLQRFQEMFSALQAYVNELRAQPKPTFKNYADILEKAIITPGLDYLYAVNGKPVLVGWGFSKNDANVVEEGKKLIKQIEKALAESAPAVANAAMPPENATPVSAAQPGETAPEANSEVNPGAAENVVEPQPPMEAPAPTDAPAPKKKKSWLLPLLAIALLILAGVVWYLMNQKKEMPDDSFAFLQGEINVRDTLANENNENVDVRLHFPGKDGKGESFLVELSQTCQGQVTARHGANNTVNLELGEQVCPNGNNYDPFSLVCIKGKASCTGINKNGDSWQVEVNVGGEAE